MRLTAFLVSCAAFAPVASGSTIDSYGGSVAYASDGSFCYKVVIGDGTADGGGEIIQDTGASSDCESADYTTDDSLVYAIGYYASTSGDDQNYDGGDYCDAISADRTALLSLVVDDSATEQTLVSDEPSTCYYTFELTASSASLTVAPTPVPADYTYDFEVADTDGWSTGSAGNAWSVHTGTTSSSSTGPSGAQSNSYYVYTETSSPNSPNVDFDLYRTFVADVETLSFYYSMYGATIGSLRVDVSNDAFSSYTTVWSKSGDQGTDAWSQASIDVTGSGYDSIRFYATSGSSYTGDIALDYIEVTAEGDYYEGDAGSDPSPTPVPTPGPTSEPTDEPTPVPSPVPSPLPTTPVPSPVPSPLPTWVKESSFPLPLTYDVKRGAGGYSGNEGGLKQRMEDGCFGTQEAPYNEGKCGPPGGGYAQNGAYGTGTNCDAGFGKCTTETDRR